MSIRFFSTQAVKVSSKKPAVELSAEAKNLLRLKRFKAGQAVPANFALQPSTKGVSFVKNPEDLAVLSCMPAEHQNRTVIIAPRVLKTLQSGTAGKEQWQIYWPNSIRWTNPLMGWTSTSDPMSNVVLNFTSKEAAIGFAERNGYKYQLQPKTSKRTVTMGTYSYQDNFLDKRTSIQLAKEGLKNKIWENPGYGQSNWFMPLKYHGDGVVQQHGPPTK
eukprot:gene516-550_t